MIGRIRKLFFNTPEGIASLLYCFMFIVKINPLWDNNGNLDIFYFAAIVLMLFTIKGRMCVSSTIRYWLPFLLMAGITHLSNFYLSTPLKESVYLAKIFLCIYLMIFLKRILPNLDLQRFVSCCSFIYMILMAFALVDRESTVLWRPMEGRMELFYTEPGELSIYAFILIIIQSYIILLVGFSKTAKINLFILLMIVIFAMGMSGITAGCISLLILFVFKKKDNKTGNKGKLLFGVFLVALVVVLNTENTVSNRLNDTINGTDYSFRTRSDGNQEKLQREMQRTNNMGCGFGCMTSAAGEDHFDEGIITSAYPMFLLETGAAGFVYLILFNTYILILCIRKRSVLAFSLFVFNFLYLLYGSFMTNPVSWILYSFALCNTAYIESNIKTLTKDRRWLA